MAVKVPPPSNDQAHKAFIAELRQMKPAEIVRMAQATGIYDQFGKLTPQFGGQPVDKPTK
jgi:hypothetical protein